MARKQRDKSKSPCKTKRSNSKIVRTCNTSKVKNVSLTRKGQNSFQQKGQIRKQLKLPQNSKKPVFTKEVPGDQGSQVLEDPGSSNTQSFSRKSNRNKRVSKLPAAQERVNKSDSNLTSAGNGRKPPRQVKKKSGNLEITNSYPLRRSMRKTQGAVLQEKQRCIEAAVVANCEDGLVIQNFKGKGRGVVATRLFSKGDFVVEYAGDLIGVAEAKVREKVYGQDFKTGCYMYYFNHHNRGYCVDATAETGRLGRLINHCRNGNLLTKTIEIENKPRLVLMAKEDIPAGKEITYDYGDRSKKSINYHPWLLS